MSQPTLEELRARVGSQRDKGHWSRRYAAEPGSGPPGKTCHDCDHLRYTGLARPSSHPKCGLTDYTAGDATTIKTRTAACRLFAGRTPTEP